VLPVQQPHVRVAKQRLLSAVNKPTLANTAEHRSAVHVNCCCCCSYTPLADPSVVRLGAIGDSPQGSGGQYSRDSSAADAGGAAAASVLSNSEALQRVSLDRLAQERAQAARNSSSSSSGGGSSGNRSQQLRHNKVSVLMRARVVVCTLSGAASQALLEVRTDSHER
jgi:hypothetical protein